MRIGVDLGGTKIEVALLDDHGNEILRRRCATPQGDYRATVDAIVSLVHEARQHLEFAGDGDCFPSGSKIGVAMPGAVSRKTGLVKNANSTCLIGKDLQGDLSRLLQCPVVVENDANCFTVSEASDGAAANAMVVFGVIIGTGTGAGICVNRRLIVGANAIAGEWGHNPLPWPAANELPGPTCYCGKRGCIETWLSGPGFSLSYRLLTGDQLDAAEIVARAATGEDAARLCLEVYEDRLARSLASVINILDPDVIVLGGGMSNIQRLYHNVPRLWMQYVFSDHIDTRLVAPKYGDSSGVRGAAWL